MPAPPPPSPPCRLLFGKDTQPVRVRLGSILPDNIIRTGNLLHHEQAASYPLRPEVPGDFLPV